MSWMVKNADGKRDALLTFSLWAMLTVIAKVLVSGVTLAISGNPFNLGGADAGVIVALLTPTLGAYVARRGMESAWPGKPGTTTTTAASSTTTERTVDKEAP